MKADHLLVADEITRWHHSVHFLAKLKESFRTYLAFPLRRDLMQVFGFVGCNELRRRSFVFRMASSPWGEPQVICIVVLVLFVRKLST